jgi:hypothetical protein
MARLGVTTRRWEPAKVAARTDSFSIVDDTPNGCPPSTIDGPGVPYHSVHALLLLGRVAEAWSARVHNHELRGTVALGHAGVRGRQWWDAPISCLSGSRSPELGVRQVPVPSRDHRPLGAWYLRYGLSYRDVKELLAERGIEVDHVTVYRWVQRFTPLLADAAQPCRHAVGDRWYVDETYVKVAGRWRYVYRAIDQYGQIIDVYMSARRDP